MVAQSTPSSPVEVGSRIRTGDIDAMKKLTRDIYADSCLRASWVAQEEVWTAILFRLHETIDNTASMNSSGSGALTLAVLQFLNNLVASESAAKVAFSTGFLKDFVSFEFPTTLHKYVFQIMANLSTGFSGDMSGNVEELVTTGLESSSIDYFDLSEDISTAFPLLLLHKNIFRALRTFSQETTEIGLRLWGSILHSFPYWLSNPQKYKVLIESAMEVGVLSFSGGLYPYLVSTYGTTPEKGYSLFKIFSSVIESAPSDDAQKEEVKQSVNLTLSIEITVSSVEKKIALFTEALNDDQHSENLLLGLDVIEELRLLTSLTKIVPELSVPQNRRKLAPLLVEALKATKKLPAKSKLATRRSTSEGSIDESELKPKDFPFIKCFIIDALTDFVAGDKETQNMVRETGGLGAVLECCVIDGNNPFMKEHAILCIKHLLENNQENQNFVAAMEAKQAADPQELARAGYEAEIINGKISIKRPN